MTFYYVEGSGLKNVGDPITISPDSPVAEADLQYNLGLTGSVSRDWFDRVSEMPISVLDFGAKGDGVTDDTAAIQAAIDAALAAGGKRVLIPNTGSDYICNSGLTVNASEDNRAGISIEMEANSVSGTNASRLQFTSETETALHVQDGNLSLINLRITSDATRAASSTQAIGIHLDGGALTSLTMTNVYLHGCWVNNQPGIGIVVEGVERGLFVMCDSNANTREGYHIVTDGTSVGISNTFINCRAFDNEKGGWKVESWFNTFIDCQSLQNHTDTTAPETDGYEVEVLNNGQNNIFINFDVEAQQVFAGTPGTDRPTNMRGYRISTKNCQIIGGIISGFDTGIWLGTTGNDCLIQYPNINNTTGSMTYGVDNDNVNNAQIFLRTKESNVTTLVRNNRFNGSVEGRTYSATQMLSGTSEENVTGAGALSPDVETTHIITTGADALTLADGDEGAHKYIVMQTDGGAGTLTPSNLANGTTITFDDVGDSAHLYFTNGAWHFMGGTATLA